MSARTRHGGRLQQASIEERIATVKGRTDLAELVQRTVTLKRKGRDLFGLCPFHGEKSPSFKVDTNGQFFHCFGCGAHGSVFDWIMRHERCTFMQALEILEGEAGDYTPQQQDADRRRQLERDQVKADDDANRLLAAGRIWAEARPLRLGDPPALYLAGRGIVLGAFPGALRYHPALRHPHSGRSHAAMIARVTRGAAFVGVHRTYLELVGERWQKATGGDGFDPKLSLGPIKGGCVDLALPGDDPHPETLGFAEGIEDALSTRILFDVPTRAVIFAGNLPEQMLPLWVKRYAIYADKDKPRRTRHVNMPEGAGLYYARQAQQRIHAEHAECRIGTARVGKDFNDQLQARLAREQRTATAIAAAQLEGETNGREKTDRRAMAQLCRARAADGCAGGAAPGNAPRVLRRRRRAVRDRHAGRQSR